MPFRKPRPGSAAAMLSSLLLLISGTPAAAQLLPSPGAVLERLPLPAPLSDPLQGTATRLDQTVERLPPRALATARIDRLTALARRYPKALELDDLGQPVVRGEVLAVSPGPEALAAAQAEGFVVARRSRADELGLELVTLTPPRGMTVQAAVRRLRALDPSGDYDFNHL